jgi:hypothetical protein
MPKRNQPGCPCCGGCKNCGCNCGPCLIPPGDMNVIFQSPDITVQVATLSPSTSGCAWHQPECEFWPIGFFTANFTFSCVGGVFSFFGLMFLEGSCNGDRSKPFQWSTSCPAPNPGNPCALWVLENGPCGDSDGIVFTVPGSNSFLIFRSANPTGSYTRPAPPVMCATVCAYLCNSVPSLAIPGAMVTISKGGTTVASGITGADGCVTLFWTGKPGPYQVDVSADDFSSFSDTVKLACGQGIFAPLLLTRDLSLAINSDACVTSATLRYDAPSNTWTSPCVACGSGSVVYQLSCQHGYLYFTWTFYDTGDCSGPGTTFGWNGNGSPFTSFGATGTVTMVPFLVVVTVNTGVGNPTTYTIS